MNLFQQIFYKTVNFASTNVVSAGFWLQNKGATTLLGLIWKKEIRNRSQDRRERKETFVWFPQLNTFF